MLAAASCAAQGLPVASPVATTTTTTAVTPTPTAVTAQGTAPATPRPTTTAVDLAKSAPLVTWDGEERFLLGANLPWFNWGCDFGCGTGARGSFGVSDHEVTTAVAAAIEQGRHAGMDVIRWWVFPGEPWQIEAGADGLPSRIADSVYADFDAALAVADLLDVDYVFTLFSAPSELPAEWLSSEAGRDRLADTLGTLFARYADHPRILTWQLVNEPEWEIWNQIVELDDVRDLAVKVTAAIHQNSSALSSIGSANLEGLQLWGGVGFDYYTAHWYDPMDSGIACAICTDYGEIDGYFGLDAPVVIGEFYGGPDVGLEQRLSAFLAKGYAGAWAWSLLPDHTADGMTIDFGGAAAFAADHSPVER